MMETRENDLAHSLLMEIMVFAELCIFFVLLGLILACSAGVFFGGVNVFGSGKHHVETPEERRKWSDS